MNPPNDPMVGGVRSPGQRSWWLSLGKGLTILAALVLLVLSQPVPRVVLLGWLRGEKFADGRPFSYWTERMDSKDSSERSQAIKALGKLGAKGVEPLLWALGHDDSQTRREAAEALGRMGPTAQAAVPALGNALRDADTTRAAAEALGRIGPTALTIVPALFADGANREVLQPWEQAQDSAVSDALARLGPGVVPTLIEVLQHPRHCGIYLAVDTLGRIDPPAQAALPALIQALVYDGLVRKKAVAAILRVSTPSEVDASHLRKLDDGLLTLDPKEEMEDATRFKEWPGFDEGARVRRVRESEAALAALRRLEPKADEYLVRGACAALRAPKGTFRESELEGVIRLLGRLGPAAREAVPLLLAGSKRKEAGYNPGGVARALGRIGVPEENLAAAIPLLLDVMGDPRSAEVRAAARGALVRIGPAALPALEVALQDKSAFRRASAAEALFRISGDRRALASLFQAGDHDARQQSAEALVRLGADAVPVLTEALKEKKAVPPEFAAQTLGRIGPAAKSAAPVLRAALKDPDPHFRLSAADALWEVAQDPTGVPTLIDILDGEKTLVSSASWVLGRMGPAAKAAIPALTRRYHRERERSEFSPELGALLSALRRIDKEAAAAAEKAALLPAAAPAGADAGDDPRAVAALEKIGARLTRAEGLPGKPVVAVDLGSREFAAADLSHLKGLPRLRELDLFRAPIGDAGMEQVGALAGLEVLHLEWTPVTDDGLARLKGLAKLKELGVGALVTDAGLQHLKGLPALEELNLFGSLVGGDGLEGLKDFPRLRRLVLNQVPGIDRGAVHLSRLRRLRALGLLNTRLSNAGLRHLADLTDLEVLDLGNTLVTEAGLEHLKRMTKLRTLDLTGTGADDRGLAHLQGLTGLRHLALGNTAVTGAGLLHLKGLVRLESLNLYNTLGTDEGLPHVKGLPSLQVLDLAGSEVSGAGLKQVAGMAALKELDLRDRPITDDDLKPLYGLPALERLGLRGTKVTTIGIAGLKAVRPLKHLSPPFELSIDPEVKKLLPGVSIH